LSLNKIQPSIKINAMNPKLKKIKDYVDYLDPLLSRGYSPVTNNQFIKLADSDGDSILFMGLLSSVQFPSENKWALKSILECQEENGMFYRSPRKRYADERGFSRDMTLGVLIAAIDSEFPQSTAQRWINYIDDERPCLVKKPKWAGGGCALRSPLYKVCYDDDDRANLTPTMWAIMGRVFKYRGWHKHDQMKQWDKSDGDISVIEAEKTELGYRLHLKAVQAYIKYLTNQSREYSQKVGEICYKRQQDNIFYEFLYRRYFTVDMIDRYLALAEIVDGSSLKNEWMWEKSKINPHESCGWDMIFLGKLILWHTVATMPVY